MSKIYEVSATETVSGFFHVEAESPAEAAYLIENGYAYYEQYGNHSDIEYSIDDLIEEETCHEVYDYDEHKAFEKAYADGRSFYDKQGQLELNEGKPAWNEAHLFALNYAREETGLGLNEQAA
jgi:hypothetical protein